MSVAEKREEISRLIRLLVSEVGRLAEFEVYDIVLGRRHPPASKALIERYEGYLELKLPPYYRAFLELHNGFDGLAFPGKDLVSVESVMPGGTRYADMCEWKKTTTEFGGGEVLDAIVIADSEEPNNWDYLDPNRISEGGEFTVVRWTPYENLRFANFRDYLEDWCLSSSREAYEEIRQQR